MLSTYNGARFLREQLDSLARQQGVEVLLHTRDDGSRDDTCDILRAYAERWPALATVSEGPNLGVPGSFMELVRTAPDDADFYAFCDQDDVWLDDKLARAAEQLADVEGPALFCSVATCVDTDLRVLGETRGHDTASFEALLFHNVAIGCTTVMNRAAFALIRSRMPAGRVFMHDWWCTLVVAAFGTIVVDDQSRTLYRQHGGNVVGLGYDAISERVRLAKKLLRSPRSFYLVHDQACEFEQRFGDMLEGDKRAALLALVRSKASLDRRVRYALTAPVPQHDPVGRLAVRGLIAAGWY